MNASNTARFAFAATLVSLTAGCAVDAGSDEASLNDVQEAEAALYERPVNDAPTFSSDPGREQLNDALDDVASQPGIANGFEPERQCRYQKGSGLPLCAPAGHEGSAPKGFEGAWLSESCDGRTYPRVVVIQREGTFTAEDQVSPCPAKEICVWSGIVDRAGSWTWDDGKVNLTVTVVSQAQFDTGNFPADLTLEPETGALVETMDGSYCPYKRMEN